MARNRHKAVFDYPWCIYCGGQTVATTVDHVPAIMMFDQRIRPKGLEFPSCAACNNGTRKSELVASLLSRVFPDATSSKDQAEVKQLFSSVNNNIPGLLEEMQVGRARAKFAAQRHGNPAGGFLDWNGPLVSAHLDAFAAKLGFAFHYYATGNPIPPGGGVVSAIHSNVDAVLGRIPSDVFDVLGDPQTLAQGAKNVGEQFRFASVRDENRNMSISFASFRESFSVTTYGAAVAEMLLVDGVMPAKLFQPGDLQKPVLGAEFPRISFNWIAR